ncbi:MAG: hypothetical protein Q8O55_08830 [Dehalococcoidales bacterium]|nr:hypothetical protein [Dehalococcoidales bacterium]
MKKQSDGVSEFLGTLKGKRLQLVIYTGTPEKLDEDERVIFYLKGLFLSITRNEQRRLLSVLRQIQAVKEKEEKNDDPSNS